MKKGIAALLALCAISSCGKGEEPVAPDQGQPVPSVPQNVKLHSATETSLTFQWDPVQGAASYQWKLTKDGTPVSDGSTANRNATVNSLERGTTYGFSVCATGPAGTSAYSAVVQAKTEGERVPEGGDPWPELKVDMPVVIPFAAVPVLGSKGLIRVFTKDGKEVDRIDLADLAKVTVLEDGTMVPKEQITNASTFHTFMDALGSGSRYRIVPYTPLRVKGKTLEIRLHSGVLDFDREYYLTMDPGVVVGDKGVTDWHFVTAPAPVSTRELRVAADGTGDFCTIQRALAYADKAGCTISVAPGTYAELLYLRDKSGITLKGDDRDKVLIRYPNSELYANGSGGGVGSRPSLGGSIGNNGGRNVFLVENCDSFTLEGLTIENSFSAPDHKGQAECLYFNSGDNSHRMTVENCSLVSWQDTFLTKGKVWVHNSLIAGHVDYIWGYPEACLFEDCEIRSRAGGYIVQARVPSAANKGFVFLNCHLTAESGVMDGSMYLARSGGSADYYDNVVFVGCTMGPVIAPAGWYTSPAPNPASPTAASGWREYGSVDPSGKAVTGHNASGKYLTSAEAELYSSRAAVLGW
jgi:pectin methylesterase-like acyl-CoA thioesterase